LALGKNQGTDWFIQLIILGKERLCGNTQSYGKTHFQGKEPQF
jgi:hypothetical protein